MAAFLCSVFLMMMRVMRFELVVIAGIFEGLHLQDDVVVSANPSRSSGLGHKG